MVNPMKSALFVGIVVAYFAMGGAIQCYDCQYPSNPDCGLLFDADGTGVEVTQCDYCVKIVSVTEVIRSCNRSAPVTGLGTPYRRPLEFFCYSDLCNGVSPIAAALSTLVVPIAVLIVGGYN